MTTDTPNHSDFSGAKRSGIEIQAVSLEQTLELAQQLHANGDHFVADRILESAQQVSREGGSARITSAISELRAACNLLVVREICQLALSHYNEGRFRQAARCFGQAARIVYGKDAIDHRSIFVAAMDACRQAARQKPRRGRWRRHKTPNLIDAARA